MQEHEIIMIIISVLYVTALFYPEITDFLRQFTNKK